MKDKYLRMFIKNSNYRGLNMEGLSNVFNMLLPFILMFGVLYLLIIRPQQTQKREHQKMLDGLKENDKVVMNSGIIGKIASLKSDKNTIILRVDDSNNTKIEFQKANVMSLLEKEDTNA